MVNTLKQFLSESSLSRVIHHTQHRNIGMITAHRNEYSEKENHERNENLKHDIRKAGHGYIHVKGHYIENKGTPQEKKVHEHSFLVIGKKGEDHGQLKHFLQKHGEKHGQDSILHKKHDEEHANLIGTTHREGADPKHGEHINVGKFHPNRAGDYHSALRNKGKRTFAFGESLEESNTLHDIRFTNGGDKSFFSRSGKEIDF